MLRQPRLLAVLLLGALVNGATFCSFTFLAPVLTAYLMVAFVPADEGSSLRPDDVLDAPVLCRNLSQAGDAPAARLGAAVRARLPLGSELRALAVSCCWCTAERSCWRRSSARRDRSCGSLSRRWRAGSG